MNDDIVMPRVKKASPELPQPINEHLKKEPENSPADRDHSEPETNKDPETIKPTSDEPKTPKKRRGFHPIKKFKSLSKKQKIIVAVVGVLILSGSGTAVTLLLRKDKPVQQATAPPPPPAAEPPKPETEPSKLTGLQVKPELNKRPVIGIMIENSPEARPQAGLKEAGVVFEAIAEGGITRFLTLFQEAQPDNIGPVRSVRPYYADWVQGFDAAIVHAGGSADGLNKLKIDNVKDIDHGANGGAFTRVSTRRAPHNLYTTMAKLDEVSKNRGYTNSNFEVIPRKEEKASATPNAKSIDFNISSALYGVHYDYDSTTNSYKRSLGGKAHTDAKAGEQLTPKVVIALVMQYGIAPNRVNSTYNSLGEGKVYVFQDGTVTEGTWKKLNTKSQITFTDASGAAIKLNPGQTWISAVGGADKVSFKP